MAPRVQFYHNTSDPLALTRELVAKAHAGGRRVAVRVADADSLRQLDRLLWSAEPLSFVPHVALDHPLAGETPVVIGVAGADTGQWPHTDLLFNLATDIPPGHARFRVLVEIVGQHDTDRLPARARWAEYRREGLELQAFDAERRTAL